MEQLRRIFESAGLTNVETVIASGNVIFDSRSKNNKAIEKKLQAKLEGSLGYTVATFVRSMKNCQPSPSANHFQKFPKRPRSSSRSPQQRRVQPPKNYSRSKARPTSFRSATARFTGSA